MNKSKFACSSTVAKLIDPHLWTFTFPDSIPIPEAISRWHLLQKDLTRLLGFVGVRVFELHPGGHGLHVHVVVPGYYDVRQVRPIAEACGFGRINVERVKHPDYVTKYITKSGRKDWPKGTRLWASFGKISRTRVRDVEVDSLGNDIFRAVRDCVITQDASANRLLCILCHGAASGRYICRASDKGGCWTVSFYDTATGADAGSFASTIYCRGSLRWKLETREYDFV